MLRDGDKTNGCQALRVRFEFAQGGGRPPAPHQVGKLSNAVSRLARSAYTGVAATFCHLVDGEPDAQLAACDVGLSVEPPEHRKLVRGDVAGSAGNAVPVDAGVLAGAAW